MENSEHISTLAEDTQTVDDLAIDILNFWFGIEYWRHNLPPNTTDYFDSLWRQKWFAKDELTAKVDAHIRDHYEPLIDKAMNGELESWRNNPHACLALIILLVWTGTLTNHQDQFSRNMYRGTAKSWGQDSKALEITLKGIEQGIDLQLKPVPRAMYYMPLLHAEDKQIASKSLELYAQLFNESKQNRLLTMQILERFHKIAKIHYTAIMTFGRYPERNKYLGRQTTVQEKAYLKLFWLLTADYGFSQSRTLWNEENGKYFRVQLRNVQ